MILSLLYGNSILVVMSYEDAYNARMGLMTVYGGLLKAIIEDQGIEKSLEYNKRSVEIDCQAMMKDFTPPDNPLTLSDIEQSLIHGNIGGGIDGSVKIVGNEAVSSNGRWDM